MYPHNNHSDMHRLSTQQHNSLEKHQRMIDGALRWQHHQQPVAATHQRHILVRRLRPALVALINLLVR